MAVIYFDLRNARLEVNERQKLAANRLRQVFTKLGVTFIKLGQFLCLRADLLPSHFVEQFTLLQDQVDPVPFSQIIETVEYELGKSIHEVFAVFEEKPIAAASIGQVHKAILKDGRRAAVKVQRKDLPKTVAEDLFLLRAFVSIAKLLFPKNDWQDWSNLIDELGNTLNAEMDYLAEGRNADRLRQVLRYFPAIIVPRIYWLCTTKKVITEELCLGIKVSQLESNANLDRKRLASLIVQAYLEQVIEHNFFHADPHGGNLALTENGEWIIYDFGMMGSISGKQKEGIRLFISSIGKNDSSGFIRSLEDMGFLKSGWRLEAGSLNELVQPLLLSLRHLNTDSGIDEVVLQEKLNLLAWQKYLRMPANVAYLLRMFVALGGVARKLNPDLNFVKIAAPYLKKLGQAEI